MIASFLDSGLDCIQVRNVVRKLFSGKDLDWRNVKKLKQLRRRLAKSKQSVPLIRFDRSCGKELLSVHQFLWYFSATILHRLGFTNCVLSVVSPPQSQTGFKSVKAFIFNLIG